MSFLYAVKLNRLCLFPKGAHHSVIFLRSLSVFPLGEQSIDWNKNRPLVFRNPILSLIDKCRSLWHLKQIQARMTITGTISDGFVSSRLIAFCAISESRNLDYCTKVLKSLEKPNSFSWNLTIRGYLESDNPRESIVLYKRMLRSHEHRPDNYTYPLLFKVCTALSLNRLGLEIFGHSMQLGLDSDIYVHNASIHMMASCGELAYARKLFDESTLRDIVTWNSLINGYVRSGRATEAIRLYRRMESDDVKPDEVTMIGVVSSCAQLEDLNLGRDFHLRIKENNLRMTTPLSNALMDMYAKCGDLGAAQRIFDSVEHRSIVSWTTLIVGYAKVGLLDTARELFEEMPHKDAVPWNAIIGGHVQAKRGKDALALFNEMQSSGVEPDEITMVHCLTACSQLGALDFGIWIHRYIERHNLHMNVALGTALVDMYAKCGNISKALGVFDDMPTRNSLTWTAIIGGLALHGNAHGAIDYFKDMVDGGLMPDEITFIGVLSACCHGGLVDEGREYFKQMISKFKLCPQLKHYSCMVDLLGRAGHLEEASRVIESMPMEADEVIWGAFFFACRMHGNVILGEQAASKLLELDPGDSGIYVLLCSMYGEANMWDKARKARTLMKERGVEKIPGCSSIELNGTVWEFIVRDKSHTQSRQIYDCLTWVSRHSGFLECFPS